MNLLNSSKSLSVVATAIGTIAALGLSTSPAAAALFKINFCGTFDDGQVEPGSFATIDVNPDGTLNTSADNSGLFDAKVTTTRGGISLMYTEEDFFEAGMGDGISGVDTFGESSFFWRLQNDGDNIFNLVIPKSVFPLTGSQTIALNENSEQRPGIPLGKEDDPDVFIERVPEPLTILGSGVALGFGAMFKKEHSRRQKKTKTKA